MGGQTQSYRTLADIYELLAEFSDSYSVRSVWGLDTDVNIGIEHVVFEETLWTFTDDLWLRGGLFSATLLYPGSLSYEQIQRAADRLPGMVYQADIYGSENVRLLETPIDIPAVTKVITNDYRAVSLRGSYEGYLESLTSKKRNAIKGLPEFSCTEVYAPKAVNALLEHYLRVYHEFNTANAIEAKLRGENYYDFSRDNVRSQARFCFMAKNAFTPFLLDVRDSKGNLVCYTLCIERDYGDKYVCFALTDLYENPNDTCAKAVTRANIAWASRHDFTHFDMENLDIDVASYRYKKLFYNASLPCALVHNVPVNNRPDWLESNT